MERCFERLGVWGGVMEALGQGTLGRRGGHKHSLGSTGGLTSGSAGLAAGSAALRRQRSLEWRHERGYSSSEDDIPTRPVGGPVDTHVFASLLAQAQQYSSKYYFSFLKNTLYDSMSV